jgi:hypothetical protein
VERLTIVIPRKHSFQRCWKMSLQNQRKRAVATIFHSLLCCASSAMMNVDSNNSAAREECEERDKTKPFPEIF